LSIDLYHPTTCHRHLHRTALLYEPHASACAELRLNAAAQLVKHRIEFGLGPDFPVA
jgi:hypothetical protein